MSKAGGELRSGASALQPGQEEAASGAAPVASCPADPAVASGTPAMSAGAAPAAPAPAATAPDLPAAPVIPPAVIRASLRASIKDSLAWSVMQGAGAGYVAPFVILAGSGLLQIAALSGLPQLGSALVQWYSANLTDRLGRRNPLIIGTGFCQGLTWLPMCLAIFLPAKPSYWVMLVSYVAFMGFAAFNNPPWQSLMGDLVPSDRRGRYFGLRNALSGVMQVSAMLFAGWWIHYAGDRPDLKFFGLSGQSVGFLSIFALAFVTRMISVYYLTRVYEPPYNPRPADRFSLLDFIRRAPRAHFGRFVFYCMIINAGYGFNGPFLAWYLLGSETILGPGGGSAASGAWHHFSTAAYGTIITASLLANLLVQPLWGRLLDRLGSKRILEIGGVGIIFIPVLFLFCRSYPHFLLVEVYDGIVSAAFNIAVANYLYDVVTPPKRARCVAYYALFIAMGTLVGNFAGAFAGLLIPVPVHVFGWTIAEPFFLMLIGSAILRVIANVLLLGSFQEFRLSRPEFGAACTPTPPGR